MSSPITQQYKEALSTLDNLAQEIESESIAAQNRGDIDGFNLAMEQFDKLQKEERPRIDQEYQDRQIKRKGELIQGIASGDLISDKETRRQYVPTYGMTNIPSFYDSDINVPNKKKTIQVFSELFEVEENKIDVESGLGAGITAKLDLLRDPDAMEFYLKENLKYPTVIRQVINGKPNFIVEEKNSKEGSKYKVVFPSGIQGVDVAGFLAANILPTAASIYGGIIGAGMGAPTGPGAIATGIAGSAAANMVVGTAQDSIVRGILGVPQDFKEILATRGTESAIGAAGDTITLGLASKLRIGKGIENAASKSIRESAEMLKDKGYKITTPEGYISGTKGGEYERVIAGGSQDMEVAKQMIRQQKVAYDFKEAAIQGSPVVDKIGTLEMIKNKLTNTADILSSKAQKIAKMPQGFANRRLARLMPDKTDWVEGGKGMADVLTKGREITRQAKNAEFDNFANKANSAGVMQTPDELADILRPIVENSDLGRNAGVEKIMVRLGNARQDAKLASELENEIARADAAGLFVPEQTRLRLKDLKEYSEPFDAIRSRNLIQNLQDQVEKDMYGASKSDIVVANATSAVRNNFSAKLEQAGLKSEWDKFKEAYVDYSAYQKGDIGKMVTDNFGDLKIAPEEILRRSLSDTKSASDVLNAAKAAGDVEGEAYLRSTMRKAYLEQTGLTSKQGFEVTKSDFKDEMIDVLFGTEAPRLKESLRELNQSLSAKGVKTANIDPKDSEGLLRLMPLNDRKKLIAEITDKAVKDQEFDTFIKNSIVQKVKAGDYRHVDNIIYGEAMLDAKTSDLLEIVGAMSPKMKQNTGADMMAAFFEKFGAKGNNAKRFEIPNSPAAEKAAGKMLWDHPKVIDSLGTWERGKGGAPTWVSNMDAVTGSKEMADELIAFSRVSESNRLLGKDEFFEMRGLASTTGVKVYAAPFEYFGHKMLATLYGSNKLKPFLRAMRKNVGEGAQQKAMQEMIRGVITTRTGIQAAMQQSQNDPEFSEQFQTIMLKVRDDIDRERQASPQQR